MSRESILSHLQRDVVLGTLIEQFGLPTLAPETNPDRLFALLGRSIVSQQVSTKAAASVFSRLESSIPGGVLTPAGLQASSMDDLRACGLSWQKAQYLAGLAQAVLSGELDLKRLQELRDEAVVEDLVKIKGVGRWTAQMFLIFALCRPDVLPLGDLGFRTAVKRQYSLSALPEATELERIAEPWRPYRTYGTWYLWRSLKNTPLTGPAL